MSKISSLSKYMLLAATSVVAVSTFGLATAQEEAEDAQATLDTVVITAQRREESMQDVPVPVTAFSGKVIEDLQLNDTLTLSKFVPSMVSGHNAGLASANSYWLRGLGNSQSVATFDPPVGTYVDDVYIARQNANNYAFFDTERVEVLRGPQGTLFGRNTTGGAISVIMRKPGDEFGGKVEATAGSYGRFTTKGTVDIPLSDKVLIKLSGYYVTDDGYLKNKATGEKLNGEENFGYRGDVRFLPSEKLTIDLSAEYMQNNGTYMGVVGLPTPSSVFKTSTTPVFYEVSQGLQQTDCDGDPVSILLNQEKGSCARTENVGFTGNAKYEFGAGTLEAIAGYRTFDQAYINNYSGNSTNRFEGFTLADATENDQTTFELKWDSELLDGRLHYVTGLFYLDESTQYDSVDFVSTVPNPTSFEVNNSKRMETGAESLAVYLQGDYDLTEKLTLTLGGRYTYESKDLSFAPLARYPALGFTSQDVLNAGLPLELTKYRFTPRIALTYEPSDNVMLFASATNGFKSGGWNGNAPRANRVLPFDPEITWSYETGVKSELLNRSLRLNANLFYSETEDLQITSGVRLPGETTVVSLAQNAGTLEVYGLEFETAYVFDEHLSMFLNGSINHGEYKDILHNDAVPDSAQVSDSTKPVRVPDYQFAGGVTYEVPVEELFGSLRASLAYRHNEPYYVATLNTARAPREDFVDLTIGYEHESGDWGAEIQGTNITDQETITANFIVLFPGQPSRVNFRIWHNF